jgi:hypothetical protein
MKRFWIWLGLCLWASMSVAADDHFTQRFALDLNGNAAYYTVNLPQAVYAASLRGDLGDLRVYNGSGEPVPYSLDAPRMPEGPPQRHIVPWFPLPANDTPAGNAPLGVSIAADGSLRAAANPQSGGSRGGDVIDLGPSGQYATSLLIHLANGNYQGRVSVEASDDLRTWRPLTDTQLLKVTSGGNTLTQERIDLEGPRGRYVRLRWVDTAPDIASVEIETRAEALDSSTAPRQWRAAQNVRPGQMAGDYVFETDGAYPVDRLCLSLPQLNTVARATIYSRGNAQAPWREVADGVLFRLQGKAAEETNPALTLIADTDRQWRIAVDMRNGGLGSGTLDVAVGWRPASLTFIARGAAPFTLAVGNAAFPSAAVTREDLLVGATSAVAAASIGMALPVAEQDARAAASTRDADAMRRYVLWAALLLAVGTLGVLAWRLIRSASG